MSDSGSDCCVVAVTWTRNGSVDPMLRMVCDYINNRGLDAKNNFLDITGAALFGVCNELITNHHLFAVVYVQSGTESNAIVRYER